VTATLKTASPGLVTAVILHNRPGTSLPMSKCDEVFLRAPWYQDGNEPCLVQGSTIASMPSAYMWHCESWPSRSQFLSPIPSYQENKKWSQISNVAQRMIHKKVTEILQQTCGSSGTPLWDASNTGKLPIDDSAMTRSDHLWDTCLWQYKGFLYWEPEVLTYQRLELAVLAHMHTCTHAHMHTCTPAEA
jgi:hypothetical protein